MTTEREGTQSVLVDRAGSLVTLTLNRPERKNAFDDEMHASLAATVDQLAGDEDCRVIVLTAVGDTFSAGGDVKEFLHRGGASGPGTEVDPASVRLQQAHQRSIVGGLRTAPAIVVVAMPGPAAGAGLGIALAGDIRIGTPRTSLVTAFASVGLAGDYGTTWQLQHLIGRSRATYHMLLNEAITSREALRLGLLNDVVPIANLASATAQIVERLAEGPSLAQRFIKANANTTESLGLYEAMDIEVARNKECELTADHMDGLRRFLRV